ncbi:MAG: amino acid adenylation domain-containing protein [Acidobacteriota bacterium]
MQLDNVEDVYALAPMQAGMLYHSLADPKSAVFLNQVSGTLHGELDVAAYRRAWAKVVRRHTILRTAIVWDGLDEPLQIVRQQAEIPWSIEDWRDLDRSQQEQRLDQRSRRDRQQGVVLDQAPLLRIALARLAEDRWHWRLTYHHLILDGWSTRLLLQEVLTLYGAERRGESSELPEPFRFRDYIAWLAEQDHAVAEDFWRNELAGFEQPTTFDAWVASDNVDEGSAHCSSTRRLTRRKTTALRAFAAEHGLTLSSVAQGVWALLASRYSRRTDLVFGLTTAGRPPQLAGIESAVGLFINTLPLRLQVEPHTLLSGWLQGLQRRQMRLQRLQHSPLAAIQEWSAVPPGQALFESLLVFENPPAATAPDAETLGIELRDLRFVEQSNYPLALLVVPGERLELILVTSGGRFSGAVADRILRHVDVALAAFVRSPQVRLGEVSLLTDAERRQVLIEWNDTYQPRQPQGCIHDHIARTARRTPQATAVLCGRQSLDYRQLLEEARRLAHHLRGLGVGPNMPVGLLVERSVQMVLGIVGILEAGGAYVPLDPTYPNDHLRHIASDAGLAVVLTQAASNAAAEALATPSTQVVRLDQPTTWLGAPPTIMAREAMEDDLAYVLYTSGSSGRPKGVMVSHRNLVHSTDARSTVYSGRVDRFLLLSSFAFDSSVAGIFWTLTTGGTLVLPGPREERDVQALEDLIRRHRVTHTLCLPALYQVLLEEASPMALASLELVMVAGEGCPATLAPLHHRILPTAALANEYGPTEASVWSTVHRLQAEAATPVSIGRPIPDTDAFLFDEDQQPVPVGLAGELYLAGEGLARGYLQRPAQTAERFVPLAHSDEPGRRLYRTGDLATYRDDGCLVFLGRADSQVKIRGHRIETSGVEAQLRQHAAIDTAAVTAQALDSGPGHPTRHRLVAHVVPTARGPEDLDPARLRQDLLATLPELMVPEAFVVLPQLPTTPNGKVDYRALPPPDEPSALGEDSATPRNETEQTVAAIWAELLGHDRVGIYDNFFALGGDSILSIQVVSRLRQAGLRVEPRHLPAHPTVADLCAVIEPTETDDPAADQEPIVGEVPLLPIQTWFLERALAVPQHWNQAALYALPAGVDAGHLATALEACLAHHDMLRARFDRAPDGTWRQTVIAPGDFRLPFSVVDSAIGALPRSCWIADAQASLDLQAGPLVRAVLQRSETPEPDRLLLVLHHLVVDAVSWPVLQQDLEAAYHQLSADEPVALPPKSVSYRRWATDLVEQADSTKRRQELSWWTSGAHPQAALPTDQSPDRQPIEADARIVNTTFPRDVTRTLTTEALEPYSTRVDELLISALVLAVHRWCGPGALRLALEGHGRSAHPEALDVSRTVGWFTTAYPVNLLLTESTESAATIKTIKEQLRAVPGDGAGYGLLRYAGSDSAVARLAALPEPQILFNYLARAREAAASPLFRQIEGADRFSRDPRNARSHWLEINAAIDHGRLTVDWIYCNGIHRRRTIENLATSFEQELRGLVEHCLADPAGGFTASDFPDAGLDDEELDQLIGQLA